ncbi:hypothetical protein pb186bvf_012448 [Paramecium bursaria]
MYRTLDDLKKDQDKDKKDKKKNTSSYTGGEKSGLAVENPDEYNQILKQAREQGEQGPRSEDPDPRSSCKITLWANGFQVDDGEFQDLKDPASKQFLAELKSGRVPQSLRAKYPNGLSVGIEDRSKNEYVPPPPPPPPKYIEFSGQGTQLGQPAAQIQVNTSNQGVIIIRNDQPTTNVAVRLSDGQTINLKVNLTTKVQQIYDHVKKIVNAGQRQIQLKAGFPPKPLTDLTQTVEEADLMDSMINQTIV